MFPHKIVVIAATAVTKAGVSIYASNATPAISNPVI
tara:strand:- start:3497 stop:3604 length:108 start_codon:yes stop_codon:yes gene_type:complete